MTAQVMIHLRYGKQHTSKLYDTKESAKKDLYKYDKVNPDTKNITIGQMCNAYMESARAKHSFTTLVDTESYMDKHFSKLFDIKFENMTSIDLERFINEIAENHTPNVANQALKKIKAVEGYCHKHGLIKERKFEVVGKIPVEAKPHYPLEIEELIEIHDLRGSYINMSLSSGLSVKFAQNQAGHSKAQTTLDIYARYNQDMSTFSGTVHKKWCVSGMFCIRSFDIKYRKFDIFSRKFLTN